MIRLMISALLFSNITFANTKFVNTHVNDLSSYLVKFQDTQKINEIDTSLIDYIEFSSTTKIVKDIIRIQLIDGSQITPKFLIGGRSYQDSSKIISNQKQYEQVSFINPTTTTTIKPFAGQGSTGGRDNIGGQEGGG